MRTSTIFLILSILTLSILASEIEIETVKEGKQAAQKEAKQTTQKEAKPVPQKEATQSNVQQPAQVPDAPKQETRQNNNEEVYDFSPRKMMKRFRRFSSIFDDDFEDLGFGFHRRVNNLMKRRRLMLKDPFFDFDIDSDFDRMRQRMRKFLAIPHRNFQAEKQASEKRVSNQRKSGLNPTLHLDESAEAFKITVKFSEFDSINWSIPEQKKNIHIEVLKTERTGIPLVKVLLRKTEQKKEGDEKGKEFLANTSLWSWSQSVYLRSPIIKDKVSAKFENQTTLVITCPKKAPKNNQITIE